jgi:EAL domain-containing protein (putative c-di-GMP-specific phosphodiesterase class I)
VETLIRHADVAMYEAKSSHGHFALYDPTADRHRPERLALVGELRRAISEGELVVHYQPKAEVGSGEVRSVEALVRWQHPRRGLLPPFEFMPVVERTGLIKPLTFYVLDVALGQCAAWARDGLGLSVAVNLSMRSLHDLELADEVARLLEKWDVAPGRLQLEITEDSIMADPVRARETLTELSAMGVGLSIDDFGTGYSSLAYLRSLPMNEIKIDRSFVMNMDKDENDAVIVRSTIDLGRNLGLDVVAEGVESETIWSQLDALGCDLLQGFYLSRPVPAGDLVAWLRERQRGEERMAS